MAEVSEATIQKGNNTMNSVGVFTIYDSKGDVYTLPSFSQNIETARREFRTQINSPDAGYLYEYAEDYTLFYLGEYDRTTGEHILNSQKSVVNALKLKDTEKLNFSTKETTPNA